MRFCSFPGCRRKHDAKNYCQTHYEQWRSGKELKPIVERKPKTAPVEFVPLLKPERPPPPVRHPTPAEVDRTLGGESEPAEAEIKDLREENAELKVRVESLLGENDRLRRANIALRQRGSARKFPDLS